MVPINFLAMLYLFYLGQVAFVVILVSVLLFSLFSAAEKEWRAFSRGLLVFLIIGIGNLSILFLPFQL
ncbi:MAG: hypothetical protein GF421_08350, partial [Candidatus Aminicenantes bacterium]|nr:hypothetical protein [Candidatus Aminicenantes bacterium]